MATVRIGFVGPQSVGKTVLAEYYTELTPNPNFEYKPTQGLRILETERKVPGLDAPVQVQVWDISGDPQYETYLGRLSVQLDGVAIVCAGTDPRLAQTCRKYYQLVVDEDRVGKHGHVICLLHKPGQPVQDDVYIEDKQLASIPVFRTSMDGDKDIIYQSIDSLVEKIAKYQREEGDLLE